MEENTMKKTRTKFSSAVYALCILLSALCIFCAFGSLPVSAAGNVARIGDITYTSIADAMAAAKSGDTVTALANGEEEFTIPSGVTFDGGEFTFGGAITSLGTIKGGTFEGKVTGFSGEIAGGTFEGGYSGSAAISGGTFNNVDITVLGNVTGGTFNCYVSFTGNGQTVTGATFNGKVYVGKNVTLVNENEGDIVLGENFKFENVQGTITCTAHIEGAATCIEPAKCRLCSEILGELGGHTAPGADGKCSACGESIVARIGDAYYTSYGDAINALHSSGTIVALESSDELILIPENVTFVGGECTFSRNVDNYGAIESGTFGSLVNNYGFIENGTFSGTVNNDGTIESGTFGGIVYNYGTISGGTFSGTVKNHGTIIDGEFKDSIINEGEIYGGEFKGYVENWSEGTIYGGTFSDSLMNIGNIINKADDEYTLTFIEGLYYTTEVSVICQDHFGYEETHKCALCGAEAVARVGEDYFFSFADAIAAAQGGGTVVALADYSNLTEIPAGVTFDGGEFTFIGAVNNHGTIAGGTFRGNVISYDNSKITGGTFGYVITESNCEISGGTFVNINNSGKITGGSFSGIVTNEGEISGGEFSGTVTSIGKITGGKFTSEEQVKNASGGIISGGTFSCKVMNYDTIENGTFEDYVTNEGEISGGEFSEINNKGKISGGTFNYVSNAGEISGGIFDGEVHSEGTIYGGTFNHDIENYCGTIYGGVFNGAVSNIANPDFGIGTIVGGEFNSTLNNAGEIINVADEYTLTLGDGFLYTEEEGASITCTDHFGGEATCTEKAKCTLCGADHIEALGHTSPDEHGKCGGCGETLVARIGDAYYSTFADAMAAAKSGETVTAIADSEETFDIPEGVTLSGGEFTFSDTVNNYGTIESGIFNGKVNNYLGIIENGTFNAFVNNSWRESIIYGGTFNADVDNGAKIYGGVFNSVVSNDGQSGYTGKIYGGEFNGMLHIGYNGAEMHNLKGDEYEIKLGEGLVLVPCDERSILVCEDHLGGKATCTEKAKCALCGEAYGEMNPHTPYDFWISGRNGHWHDCQYCGADIDFEEHNIKTEWSYDENSHWQECEKCGYNEYYIEHDPGEDDGDCTTAITCTDCGKIMVEAKASHTPGEDDGDCTTDITCKDCGKAVTEGADSHTGGTATCEEKAKCSVCGTEYGEALGHNDENKDHKCDRECGKTDMGAHADSTTDSDHVCDYGCGAVLEACNDANGDYACDVCSAQVGTPPAQTTTGTTTPTQTTTGTTTPTQTTTGTTTPTQTTTGTTTPTQTTTGTTTPTQTTAGTTTPTQTTTGTTTPTQSTGATHTTASSSAPGMPEEPVYANCGGCTQSAAKGAEPMLFGGAVIAILGASVGGKYFGKKRKDDFDENGNE